MPWVVHDNVWRGYCQGGFCPGWGGLCPGFLTTAPDGRLVDAAVTASVEGEVCTVADCGMRALPACLPVWSVVRATHAETANCVIIAPYHSLGPVAGSDVPFAESSFTILFGHRATSSVPKTVMLRSTPLEYSVLYFQV